MKEDFGIMKYIKKKYYQENYGVGKDGKPIDGEAFPKNNMKNIKDKYFRGILQDIKLPPEVKRDKDGKETCMDKGINAKLLVDKIE